MIEGLVNSWKMFRSTIRGFDTSKQLAMGVTLGMLAGLIPKDSLFAYGFGCLLLLSTANLLTGGISIFCFSWIGALLDPMTHRLGNYVLTVDYFEPTLAKLNELPLVPWTRFENTVVTGNLLLGLIIAIPIYRLSLVTFERYRKTVSDRITNSRFGRWIFALPAETETA